MKFKTDENLPVEVADELRRNGRDAITVVEQRLAGRPDARVAEVCKAEGRALITLDLNFSDIRRYPPNEYAGIIVLRPTVQSIKNIGILIRKVIDTLPTNPLFGRLWIVDDAQIRIR